MSKNTAYFYISKLFHFFCRNFLLFLNWGFLQFNTIGVNAIVLIYRQIKGVNF